MLGTSCAERRGCRQLEWLHHSRLDFISRLRVEYVESWLVLQWLQYQWEWACVMLAGGLDIHWRMNVLVCRSPNVNLRYVGKMTNCFWNTQYTRSNGREGEYTQQFISSQVIILSVDVRGRSRRIFWLLYRWWYFDGLLPDIYYYRGMMCAIDGVIQKGWALFGPHLSDRGISRCVGLMIGVCLNDVRVARGVIACLLPTTSLVALYKDLTEWAVRSTFGACDVVRIIMLQLLPVL